MAVRLLIENAVALGVAVFIGVLWVKGAAKALRRATARRLRRA